VQQFAVIFSREFVNLKLTNCSFSITAKKRGNTMQAHVKHGNNQVIAD